MFFKNHDLITFSENWVDSTSKYLGIGSFDGLLWKRSDVKVQLRNFIMQKKNVDNVLFDLSSNFRKAKNWEITYLQHFGGQQGSQERCSPFLAIRQCIQQVVE